jgi:phospholipase D1/2
VHIVPSCREFFSGTAVDCLLMTRGKEDGFVQDQFAGFCYSHHQKTVICDAPCEEVGKRIVAFIGGLDITDGRYDDPTFPLWSTLSTLHKDDFYNNIVPGATIETGPREPWHDCHAKLEGPIVADVLGNFVERCKKQAPEMASSLYDPHQDGFDFQAPGTKTH